MIKKSVLTLCGVISLVHLAYAQDQGVSDDTMQELLSDITATTPRGVRGVITSLENPNYKQQNWLFSVTTAAWQPKMDGLLSASIIDTDLIEPVKYIFSFNYPNFQWGFSVKGELGYYFDYDGWALSLGYNYFHTKGHQTLNLESGTTSPTTPYLIPVPAIAFDLTRPSLLSSDLTANLATIGNTSLNFVLNDAFIKFGRSFFLSKSFSLCPNIGIKSTWFSTQSTSRFSGGGFFYESANGEEYTLNGLGDTTVFINNNFKFYAIGLRAGLDGKWYITKQLNIYANATGAALFSYFSHRIKNTYSLYPSNLYLGREKPKGVIPYSDVEIGFGYERDFNNLQQHLALQIGCEFQTFNKANLYTQIGSPGNISTYGFNFNLLFGF